MMGKNTYTQREREKKRERERDRVRYIKIERKENREGRDSAI